MSLEFYRWMLAAIVAACVGVALIWALIVPAFQQADELAHVDCAFALYDSGRPFFVPRAVPATLVTREAKYLASLAHYRRLRYDPSARESLSAMPLEWARHRHVDGLDASLQAPAPGARMPYVMFVYPMAYYAILAAIMRTVHGSGGSLEQAFVAARLFNVVCLIPTLLLASRIFRFAGLNRTNVLLATLVTGIFPLTSWVAGYVQPDNLSLLLMTAALYAMLRWRREPCSIFGAFLLTTALTALFLTKYQYAAAAWLAAVALLSSRLGFRSTRRYVAGTMSAIIIFPVAAFVAALMLSPVSHTGSSLALVHSATGHLSNGAPALFSGGLLGAAFDIVDTFFGGYAFDGFWFRFGFRSGSFVAGDVRTGLKFVLIAVTFAFLFALSMLIVKRWIRIARVARERSALSAIRCLGSGAALHLYLATTAILFLARAATDDRLQLLGRYWLPVIVPTLVLLLTDVPKLITSYARRRVAVGSTTLVLALAAVLAAVNGVRAMYADFYIPSLHRTTFAVLARVEDLRNVSPARNLASAVPLDYERAIYSSGIAVDGSTGLPAKRVVLVVDGSRRYVARSGLPSQDIAEIYHDDAIAKSGFALVLPPNALGPGTHRLRFQIEDGSRIPAVRIGPDVNVIERVHRKQREA